MTPFLIAHKVRGEPAFDVATRMDCPECATAGCFECDDLGWWWIIPTSGHRAYPWHWAEIANTEILDTMPPTLPDHYPTCEAPTVSLSSLMGLSAKSKPASSTKIFRRM